MPQIHTSKMNLVHIEQPHDHRDDLYQAFSFHIDLLWAESCCKRASGLRRGGPSFGLADDPLRTNGR